MTDTHSERVRDAFTTQAAAFEDSRLNRVLTTESEWLFERLRCESSDMLLDVAAGTGHAARTLAKRVRAAVAVDLTPAMLATGKRAADADGVRSVVFQQGDAAALAFLDASFDVVVTRHALHHMRDPAAVLAEMVRCLRPGGRIAVADLVGDDDARLARAQDRVERLRDPSHVRVLSVAELSELLAGLGLRDLDAEARALVRPLDPWLAMAASRPVDVEAARAVLREEVEGGEPTGLHAREVDGELHIVQRLASVIAQRPS